MVGEVQAALDFVHCAGADKSMLKECQDGSDWAGAYSPLHTPPLDRKRVFLLGYSLGAIVGLHAAAMLAGVAGVAAFGGWTPFRDTVGDGLTGGNRYLFETHALIPKLGLFQDDERAVPYDYDELIAAIAPRPVLLHAPKLNRFADPGAVATAASAAGKAWGGGSSSAFMFASPSNVSAFNDAEIAAALLWVESFVVGGPHPSK